MSYPFSDYDHRHVSERETAHQWPDGQWDLEGWEDCLWCSGIEVLRFGGLEIPASLTEAEALRQASGRKPLGGSNQDDLKLGVERRYARTLRRMTGQDNLKTLKPGQAAVISGSFAGFKAGHTLRRHDPDYTGGHAVAIFKVDDQERFWWCDPLAPANYTGQWANLDQVLLFTYDNSVFSVVDRDEFNPEVQVLNYTITVESEGQIKVNTGHLWRLSDGEVVKVPAGYIRNVVAEIKLSKPLTGGAGDQQNGYLVTYAQGTPFFVLGKDATRLSNTVKTYTQAEHDAIVTPLKDQIARERAEDAEVAAVLTTAAERIVRS